MKKTIDIFKESNKIRLEDIHLSKIKILRSSELNIEYNSINLDLLKNKPLIINPNDQKQCIALNDLAKNIPIIFSKNSIKNNLYSKKNLDCFLNIDFPSVVLVKHSMSKHNINVYSQMLNNSAGKSYTMRLLISKKSMGKSVAQNVRFNYNSDEQMKSNFEYIKANKNIKGLIYLSDYCLSYKRINNKDLITSSSINNEGIELLGLDYKRIEASKMSKI